jgi:hypothetical protein
MNNDTCNYRFIIQFFFWAKESKVNTQSRKMKLRISKHKARPRCNRNTSCLQTAELSCPLRRRQRTNDYFVSTWRQPSSHSWHIPQLLMTTTCNKATTLTCNTNCTKRTLNGDIWTAHVWYFISPTTTKEWGWVHAFRKRRGCTPTA